jgi:hypothetical protein
MIRNTAKSTRKSTATPAPAPARAAPPELPAAAVPIEPPLTFSHNSPVKSCVHVHTNAGTVDGLLEGVHTPPERHGEDAHALIRVLQRAPVNPTGQVHEKVVPPFCATQVLRAEQGEEAHGFADTVGVGDADGRREAVIPDDDARLDGIADTAGGADGDIAAARTDDGALTIAT